MAKRACHRTLRPLSQTSEREPREPLSETEESSRFARIKNFHETRFDSLDFDPTLDDYEEGE
jgi:hypothetical protein